MSHAVLEVIVLRPLQGLIAYALYIIAQTTTQTATLQRCTANLILGKQKLHSVNCGVLRCVRDSNS